MAQEPAQKKQGVRPPGGAGDDGSAETRARFQIPEGYFEAYLDGGRPHGVEGTPNWQAVLGERASEMLSKASGAGFDRAFGAWLCDEHLGLPAFFAEFSAEAPADRKQAMRERLAMLAPFDRVLLRAFVVHRGLDAAVVRALGADGMHAFEAAPPPVEEKPAEAATKSAAKADAKVDAKADAAPDATPDATADATAAAPKAEKPVGDSLFDRLFGALLRDLRAPAGPQPILAEVDALDEQAYAALALLVDGHNAWEPLDAILGPSLGALVGRKRMAPLSRLAGRQSCPPDEQARQLAILQQLSPYEKRHLVALVVTSGTAKRLVPLLGEAFVTWLGGDFVDPPPAPVEDPAAALTALSPLLPAAKRRVLAALRKQAAGPSLAEALAGDHDAFVAGYYRALPPLDPRLEPLPRWALEALRRVPADELALLVPAGDPSAEAADADIKTELPSGATDAQLKAMRPLLRGTVVPAEQREQMLAQLAGLGQLELGALLGRLTLDELAQLEVSLGPRFRRVVQDTYYRPLKLTLERIPPDGTLPAAEQTALARPLGEASPWLRELLRERIAGETTAERLSVLVGVELDEAKKRQLGLGDAPATPPPPAASLVLTPPQRRAAAKVLAKLAPAQFSQHARDVRPDVLRRFAGAAVEDDLGRALLARLPPESGLAPPPLPPQIELVQLSQFFERLVATQEGANDLPRQGPTNAPARKRQHEDEPLVEGADLDTLFRELFGRELGPATDETVDTTRPRAERFASLPERVRRGLSSKLRAAGLLARLEAALGDTFKAAVLPDDPV